MKEFVSGYTQLTQEAQRLSSEILKQSTQLKANYEKLSQTFDTLGKMHKKIKVGSQYKLFKKMSTVMSASSDYLGKQGQLTGSYATDVIKFYEHEY